MNWCRVHGDSPSAQEDLRLRAVAALVAGRTREDVSAVFQTLAQGKGQVGEVAGKAGAKRSWLSRTDAGSAINQ